MQKILVISYFFPPSGGPAVQRNLKLCKYLSEMGCETSVLTSDKKAYKVLDESLVKEIPEAVKVYRCRFNDYNRKFGKNVLCNKILALTNVILNLPDNKLFWNLKLKKYIDYIMVKNHIDTVIISIPPYSTAMLTKYIKCRYNKQVIIDYRDPWVHSPIQRFLPFYKLINKKLEGNVLKKVDGIISVSKPIINKIVDEYDFKKKTQVIPNGYDKEAMLQPNLVENEKFTITFIGNFSSKNNPNNLIIAIDEAISEGYINKEKINLIFVGNNEKYASSEYISCTGYLPHNEVFNYTKNTDLLLLVLNSNNNLGTYSGKIFEYIVSSKPILAIVPKAGVAAELIRETNTGFIAEESDIKEIKETLIKSYNLWKKHKLVINGNYDVIKRYSRYELTKKILEFINIKNEV
ncbi:glycosyltransferase [Clostridium sp.]|uniref:glycosyltransferase n=1 Tax=Clostridium sp. TaxID=1506 RepID=UPI0032165268